MRSNRTRRSGASSFWPMPTNFEEQRHTKPGLSITRSTKEWNPIVAQPSTFGSISSSQGHSQKLSAADQSFMTQSGVSTQVYSDTPLVNEDDRQDTTERLEEQAETEDENVYPGPLPLTILIIGLCLSVFLISLDRTIITTVYSLSSHPSTLMLIGAGYPIYHRRVSFFRRHWMVWIGLSSYSLSLPATLWPNLHAFQHEMVVLSVNHGFRNRKFDLWCCSQLSSLDCGKGACRLGKRWNLDW